MKQKGKIMQADKLRDIHYEIRGPIMEEASKIEASGEKIIKLNIGNPGQFGFCAPKCIIEGITKDLQNAHPYSDSKGLHTAREAIYHYYNAKNFSNLSFDDIFIGNGVSEMILITMQALLNSGDEILIPAPDYPLWTAAAKLAGGNPIHYICDESQEWLPDIDDIKRKLSPKTKGIVLINPNNPTGALYHKDLLEKIVRLAQQNNLIIFSDESYEKLIMDNHEYTSIGEISDDVAVVTYNGLSKSHFVAGFRAGWAVISGNKKKIGEYIKGINI